MKSHKELSDIEFIEAFKNCTLPEELFNHEAHLRLAWLQLKTEGEMRAIQNVSMMILKYTKHLGAVSIFNMDLTVAGVKLVAKLDSLDSYGDFDKFLSRNPKLLNDFKGLINEHYQLDL